MHDGQLERYLWHPRRGAADSAFPRAQARERLGGRVRVPDESRSVAEDMRGRMDERAEAGRLTAFQGTGSLFGKQRTIRQLLLAH